LTWAAYYVNRPQALNLWTYQFLYLFLVADIVEPRLFQRLRRRGIAPAILDVRLASLTFLLIPMLLAMNHFIVVATLMPDVKPQIILSTLSGILVPDDVATNLRSQADFLEKQNASSTLFFSRHSYSLSMLTRRFNPLPAQDVFAETFTHSDFDQMVADIYKVSPRVILFDAPGDKSLDAENLPLTSYNMQFFERLKVQLSGHYDQTSTTNGWQIWRLRAPASTSTR
jgi:hypothetical protein